MNLALVSDTGGFGLFQTPSHVTHEAMRVYYTGCRGDAAAAHAVTVYRAWLLSLRIDREEVAATIRRIEAFLGFAPNARFVAG